MDIEEYIKIRLENQVMYYDKKSISFKKYHYWYSVISIIGAAIGSIMAALGIAFSWIIPWAAVITSLTTITISIDNLGKYQELSIQYRNTCEKLKQEKVLFQFQAGEYSKNTLEENKRLLIERCESIMSTEIGTWAQLNEKKS